MLGELLGGNIVIRGMIVGIYDDWDSPRIGMMIKRAFEELGVEISYINLKPLTFSLISHINILMVNVEFYKKALKINPDFILIIKGNEILPLTLKKIKANTSAVICNWNPDNPFNAKVVSQNHLKCIPYIDKYFIWGTFLIDKLKDIGCKEVIHLPFAYDSLIHNNIWDKDRTNEKNKLFDVLFIGTWSKYRESILKHITHYPLTIYGSVGSKYSAPSIKNDALQKLHTKYPVFGRQYSKLLCQSKIVLNLLRPQNHPGHNMKTFEIPATGSFMLSTRTPEQNLFLIEGKEAEYFSSVQELRYKIEYYLDDEIARKKIAHNGYVKIIGKHSYSNRAKTILRELGN